MHDVGTALNAVRTRIAELERRYRREPGSVTLLAVSKTKPPEAVRAAVAAGQPAFGENHLQDAMTKVDALDGQGVSWHFIGAVQSNKTRPIAAHFDWSTASSGKGHRDPVLSASDRAAGRRRVHESCERRGHNRGCRPRRSNPSSIDRELPGLRWRA